MASDQPSQDIVNRLYEVKQELAMKAASDSAFRKDLLSDPLATIEKEYSLPTGALAQSGLNIEIVEEKPNTIMVPILPSIDDTELSDDQLEAVAGGGISEQKLVGTLSGLLNKGSAVVNAVVRSW